MSEETPTKRRTKSVSPWVLDRDLASNAIDFFEQLLTHSKGHHSGKPFRLEPWQREITAKAFGTVERRTRRRRYRRVYVEIPRKNGKSTFGAGVGIKLLTADQEPGAEIYSAAADRSQAGIIFTEAKSMILNQPILNEIATIYRRSIVVPETMSSYKVLSADAQTKHGLNAHGIIFDELHTQDDRELFDVLTTSTGARRQPQTWMFTTAGYDPETICWEIHEYARDVASGKIDDPEFFGVIFAADPEDDWKSPATWRKANPNLGVSLDPDYIARECARAMNVPAYENTFKRLHLNIWTQQDVRWLPIDVWDRNARPLRPLEDRKCFVGLDLSRKTDITAAVSVFPDEDGTFDILPHFWIPEEAIEEREKRDRVPYREWTKAGFVTATPGNVIDYSAVEELLARWHDRFGIAEIGYDPWGATQLALSLQDRGLVCKEFPQTMKYVSEPTKTLESLLLQGRIRHAGHPVLRWMFNNVAVISDDNANIRLSKKRSKGRIDGIVATVTGIGRATLSVDSTSVYERRGLRTL